MTHTPDTVQWSDELTDCFDYDAGNPHPRAQCEACHRTMVAVDDEACSAICAQILGVSPPPTRAARHAWRAKFVKMPWET